jgi:excisionase family DNA binding protein
MSDLIRTGEAATILGSSRQHVVDLCNRGLLSFERSPKQRRLRRSEVEAFARRPASTLALNRDQKQSLWLHAAVATRMAIAPEETTALARSNLARLRDVHGPIVSARWLDEWERILREGPEAILEVLTSTSPRAVDLRQNSPFAGALPDAQRQAVLHAFRTANSH